MSEAILSHSASTVITRAQLQTLTAPEPRGRFHRPVRHYDLVREVTDGLEKYGVEVSSEKLAVSRDANKLFGVLDLVDNAENGFGFNAAQQAGLARSEVDKGRGLTLGLRSANDQSFSIQIVVGLRVFVCDNLCFSGDFLALSRKHTTGVNLRDEVERGLERYFQQSEALRGQVRRLEETPLRVTHARDIIYDAIVKEVLPARFLKPVHQAYFEPKQEWTDCQPDTKFGLHNAFTRVIRDEPTRPQLAYSTAIGRHFGLTSAVN